MMNLIVKHYKNNWGGNPEIRTWEKGPYNKLNNDFRVLEFAPNIKRDMWTYATVGMSNIIEENPIELHIFSKIKDNRLIELLTVVAYYHQNTCNLDLNHTVNFGRPWQENSNCTHGLISLPYLDGPSLENLYFSEYHKNLKFFWLVPLTEDEIEYKIQNGIEALEDKLEKENFNYLNPYRKSVI